MDAVKPISAFVFPDEVQVEWDVSEVQAAFVTTRLVTLAVTASPSEVM